MRCSLFAVCYVAHCLSLVVVRCVVVLFLVRCSLFVVRCSLSVVCCLLLFAVVFVGCALSAVWGL